MATATVTKIVKLEIGLASLLEIESRQAGIPQSEVIRRALTSYLNSKVKGQEELWKQQ